MALPSSGPLGIDAIRTELQQSQGNNSLRTLSSLAGFSTPDAISEFYGYSYTNYRSFSIYDQGQSQGEVCNIIDQDNLTLYFYESGGDGSPACPNVSVTLYTDTALTTPFDGADRWYHSGQCNSGYYILGTPNRGFIESIDPC
jgi:hypothetical protein